MSRCPTFGGIGRNVSDTIGWLFNANGLFTVISFRRSLELNGGVEDPSYDFIRQGICPSKVEIFAWGSPGPATIGGVLRDASGKVLCLFSFFLGQLDANSAEILAIRKACKLYVSRRDLVGRKVTIASDSETAVSWVGQYECGLQQQNNKKAQGSAEILFFGRHLMFPSFIFVFVFVFVYVHGRLLKWLPLTFSSIEHALFTSMLYCTALRSCVVFVVLVQNQWIIFLKCPLATALWEAVFSTFQRHVSINTWGSFFRQAMAALSLVWRSIYDSNHLGIGCMRNCVDDLLILHRFGLSGRPGLVRLPGVFDKLGSAAFIRSRIWSSRFLIYSGKVIRWLMLSLNTLRVFLLIPGCLPLLRSVLRLLILPKGFSAYDHL
ncbi:hypothetical protein Dsin_012616 [Dipteronia sinensis]|uniref:RNase H type-1 domain-containing protein n=1 Tax=Dipteronia sinensis TaxID=43782 RepID=A0AAE0E873_9ROSI|nr:hypothetical protein Dsin_012616 [Dipteronia sinensis]